MFCQGLFTGMETHGFDVKAAERVGREQVLDRIVVNLHDAHRDAGVARAAALLCHPAHAIESILCYEIIKLYNTIKSIQFLLPLSLCCVLTCREDGDSDGGTARGATPPEKKVDSSGGHDM